MAFGVQILAKACFSFFCLGFLTAFREFFVIGGMPHVISTGVRFDNADRYFKTGRNFSKPSEVFEAFTSPVGLRGFYNVRLPSDKGSTHNYTAYYDQLLQPYVGRRNVNILEVGVKMGGSLMLWRELFGDDATVYGVDLDPNVPTFRSEPHIKVYAGVSSTKPAQVENVLAGTKLDIIIDDGSHRSIHQMLTIFSLWRHLKPDGLYIIEDVENTCSLIRQLWSFVLPRGDWKEHAQTFRLLNKNLFEVESLLKAGSHKWAEGLWLSVHSDSTQQRLVALYPNASAAKEHIIEPYCTMNGAPGARCAAKMDTCRPELEKGLHKIGLHNLHEIE